MAMPVVTYACELTGLITTTMSVAGASGDAETSDPNSQCPCEGQMQDVCGPQTADCEALVDCHGDSFESDACCSSHPERVTAVLSTTKEPVHTSPALATVLSDRSAERPDDPRFEAPGHERALPHRVKAPVHILHSSLLL